MPSLTVHGTTRLDSRVETRRGRRTCFTNTARRVSAIGGSLRDVHFLAGRSDLVITRRHIEGFEEARKQGIDQMEQKKFE